MTLVNTRGFVTHELHDNSGWLVTRTRTKTAIRHEVNCNSTHRHLSPSPSHNPPVSGTGEARRDDRCVSSCRDHSPVVMTWSRPQPRHFPGTIVHPHQLSFGATSVTLNTQLHCCRVHGYKEAYCRDCELQHYSHGDDVVMMSRTEACVCFQLPPSAQAQLLLGQVGQVSVCDVLSRVLCSLCVPPCSSLHFKCFVFICFDYILELFVIFQCMKHVMCS